MPDSIKLALVAIATTSLDRNDETKDLAVWVGTRDSKPDTWLAGFCDPQALQDFWSTGSGTGNVLEGNAPDALAGWLNADPVGIEDESGNTTKPRHEGKILRIDRIVRVLFFRGDTKLTAGANPDPLARIDCAGFVENVADDKPVPAPAEWTVSRLTLKAKDRWDANTRPVEIVDLELICHIPMALNAHDADDGSPAALAKRYDTRIMLKAAATWKSGKKNALWDDKAYGMGARFDTVQLGFSEANSIGWSSSVERIDQLCNRQAAFHTATALSNGAPAYHLFESFKSAPPGGSHIGSALREVGFRRAAGTDPVPKQMVLRCELGFDVANWTRIWGGLIEPFTGLSQPSGPLGNGNVDVRLSQEQRASDLVLDLGPAVDTEWFFAVRIEQREASIEGALLAQLNAQESHVRAPLAALRPRTGISILPHLDDSDEKGMPWHLAGRLRAPSGRRRILLQFSGDRWSRATAATAGLDLRRFQPRANLDMWQDRQIMDALAIGPQTKALTRDVTATFNCVQLASGNHLALKRTIVCAVDQEWQLSQDKPRPHDIAFVMKGSVASQDRLRVGALEFSLAKGEKAPGQAEYLFRRDVSGWTIEANLSDLPVRPVTQDWLDEDDSDHPSLVMPFYQTAAADRVDLVATETFGGGQDQSVSFEIRARPLNKTDDAVPKTSGKLLIVDPAPFRVIAVEAPSFTADENRSDAVARYQPGDDGIHAWQIYDARQTVRLLLPPQVIGEAMEKTAAKRADRPQDIMPGVPAAARFGSAGRIDIDPTYRDTDTHEAPWNLRRILNRISDRPPGALIRDLRVELAYGLVVRHTPQAETWLAEMGGIVGRAPRPDPARPDDYETTVLRAARKRLAVDKVWAGRPEAPFETNKYLVFALRDGHATETRFRFPANEGYPKKTEGQPDPADDKTSLRDTFAEPGSEEDQSAFPGGVPWAFESANILAEVYATPLSRTGRLGNLHFSALGAWGNQRAEFADGKSVVETETTMGRMHYYRLERLGRIGAWYNRAKHVIIYRRTVAPSAQFYNLEPIGLKQDEHAGRPILRKVEEYVEILQPERRYPERGQSLRERGALAACRFVSRKIRVDSDWGRDVRNEGWAIPLWRRDFEVLPPSDDPDNPANLYPKPLVQQVVVGQDNQDATIEIANPELLYFYTSTTRGETADNIDDWHSVVPFDMPEAGQPPVRETAGPRGIDLHDGMLPPAARLAPGFESLTFASVDTRTAVRLTAGRTEDGPASVLKNVTISRGRPLAGDTETPEGRARLAGAKATQLAVDMRGRLDRMLGAFPGQFENLARDYIGNPRERAKAAVNRARTHIDDEIGSLLTELNGQLENLVTGLKDDLATLKRDAVVNRLIAEAARNLHAERNRLEQRVRSAIAQATKATDIAVTAFADQRSRDINTAADRLDALTAGPMDPAVLRDLQAYLKACIDIGNPDAAAENALDDIREAFKRIPVNIEALWSALDMPPAVREASEALEKFRTRVNGLIDEVEGWVAATDDELANLMDGFRTFRAEVGARIDTALRILDAAADNQQIPANLRTVARMGRLALPKVSGTLQKLEREFDTVTVPEFIAFRGKLKLELQDLKLPPLPHLPDSVPDEFKTYVATLAEKGEALFESGIKAVFVPVLTELGEDAEAVEKDAEDFLKATTELTTAMVDSARAAARQLREVFGADIMRLEAEVRTANAGLGRKLDISVADAGVAIGTTIDEVAKGLSAYLDAALGGCLTAGANSDKWLKSLHEQIAGLEAGTTTLAGYLTERVNALADALLKVIDTTADKVDACRGVIEREVNKVARDVGERLDGALGDVQRDLAQHLGRRPGEIIDGLVVAANQGRSLYQEGDNILRLVRAVGEPPITQDLGFNRPEVAFAFDAARSVVDVSPVLALANRATAAAAAVQQVGEASERLLEGFGLRQPLKGIGENLVNDLRKGLPLPQSLPDMSAIRGLFDGMGLPDIGEGVKVTRKFDPERRELLMQADIDIKFDESLTAFQMGPVALILDQGYFRATSRLEVHANGRTEKSVKGQLAGDWRLVSAGMDVVTFEKTPLLFDEGGHLDFRIAPERVRLAPSLEFLTNLIAAYKGGEAPFSIRPISLAGIPVGVQTRLDMDMPPLQTGAFGVSDLKLGVGFGIVALPEFEIFTSLDVSSRDAPFTLNVWILNGGGYVTTRLSYRPLARPRPVMSYTLDIAIVAGVGMGFSFGVVSGGVWLQIGCSVALTWTTGAGGNVTIVTAFLLARGNVDVAGLVTAGIMLRLEISYDGSLMIARGILRLSFRISMFYTLNVSQGCQYRLMGEERPQTQSNYAESFA